MRETGAWIFGWWLVTSTIHEQDALVVLEICVLLLWCLLVLVTTVYCSWVQQKGSVGMELSESVQRQENQLGKRSRTRLGLQLLEEGISSFQVRSWQSPTIHGGKGTPAICVCPHVADSTVWDLKTQRGQCLIVCATHWPGEAKRHLA